VTGLLGSGAFSFVCLAYVLRKYMHWLSLGLLRTCLQSSHTLIGQVVQSTMLLKYSAQCPHLTDELVLLWIHVCVWGVSGAELFNVGIVCSVVGVGWVVL